MTAHDSVPSRNKVERSATAGNDGVCDSFGDFRIVTVRYHNGFIARIRRKDGNQMMVRGEIQAAIGTKLCPTEQAAVDEAKAIISRGYLKSMA
jgi:hypothetical protein